MVRLDESFTTFSPETTNNPPIFDSHDFERSFRPANAVSIRRMELNFVAIFFRWLHVMSACVLIGSVFFYQVLLPAGTAAMEPGVREAAERRWRRGFKLTVHITLLMFLISGVYNAIRNWSIYKIHSPLIHSAFGLHMLLGLGAITLLMIVLAGREPKAGRAGWIRWALILLVLGVAAGSTLKSAREWQTAHNDEASHGPPATAPR